MRKSSAALAALTFVLACTLAVAGQDATPTQTGTRAERPANAAQRTTAELDALYSKAPWGKVVRSPGRAAKQTTQASAPAKDEIQHNEISAQVSGIYTSHSFSAPVKHFDTHSAGLLLGYRYHFDDWSAIEVEYGYTRNGQRYVTPPTTPGLPGALVGVPATMHEVVGNGVVTTPRLLGILQPFVLAGGGVVIFDPRSPSDITPVSRQTRAAGNVGVGFDFHISHVGARIEYQALIFKVPDFKNPALTTNKVSFINQPSAGLVFTF